MKLAQFFGYFALLLGGGITVKSIFTLVIGKGTTQEAQRWIAIGVVLFGVGYAMSSLTTIASAVATACEIGAVKPLCGNSETQKAEEARIKADAEQRAAVLKQKHDAEIAILRLEAERMAAEVEKAKTDTVRAKAETERIRIESEARAQEAEAARLQVLRDAETARQQAIIEARRREQAAFAESQRRESERLARRRSQCEPCCSAATIQSGLVSARSRFGECMDECTTASRGYRSFPQCN